jgi:hypothetical protein
MLNILPPRNLVAYEIVMKTIVQSLIAIDIRRYHGAINSIGFAFRLIKYKITEN